MGDESNALTGIRLVSDWSKWLIAIETGAIAIIGVAIKVDNSALPLWAKAIGTGSIASFLISIAAAVTLLVALMMRDSIAGWLFRVTTRGLAFVESLFYFMGMICFSALIIALIWAPPASTVTSADVPQPADAVAPAYTATPPPATMPAEGQRIIFLADFAGTGNSDVWAIRPDGKGLTHLTDTPTLNEVWAQLSPDGGSLLTVARVKPGRSRYDHSYFLTDLMTGSTQELLKQVDLKRDDPTFTPDGQQLVFTRNRTAVDYEDSDIWRADLDGGNLFRVTTTDYNNFLPHMRADGIIAYTHAIKFQAGSATIALIDANGANRILLPKAAPGNNQNSRWSHDGSKIVFAVEGVGIYSMDADGQNIAPLAVDAGAACFSPDDAWLAFSRRGGLYIMQSDGGAQQLVLADPGVRRTVDFGILAPSGQ